MIPFVCSNLPPLGKILHSSPVCFLYTQPLPPSIIRKGRENEDLFLMSVCLSRVGFLLLPGGDGTDDGGGEGVERVFMGNVHRCSTYKVVRLHKTRMD